VRYLEVITWYYDSYENYFVDENGEIVYDIFRVISPSRLFYLKSVLGNDYDHTEYIKDIKPGVIYELVWLVTEEEGYDYDN
jgi:hypothetical protein